MNYVKVKNNSVNILYTKFYLQDADILAPLLLGKLLVRRFNNGLEVRARITETECYLGEGDTACHAHKGRTNRTDVMYREGGITYVYLCYGIHNMLNIVTGAESSPQAVLIRGVEVNEELGVSNEELQTRSAVIARSQATKQSHVQKLISGPGRVTKFLDIDRNHNGISLTTSDTIWLEDDGYVPLYTTTPRIGINYAKDKDRERLWRYLTTSTP